MYQTHHKTQLKMSTLKYDPCLLIIKDGQPFGVVNMQTNDTLILSIAAFLLLKDKKRKLASFWAKPKILLLTDTPLEFNGARLTLDNDSITMCQKDQSMKISIINTIAINRA